MMMKLITALLTTAAIAAGGHEMLNAGQDASNPYYKMMVADNGTPGPLGGVFWSFGKGSLRCGRLNNQLYIDTGHQPVTKLDFGSLARTAIERDVLKGKWDGSWDSSLMVDTSIVFDTAGRAYTLLVPRYSNLKQAVLLWSDDSCHSWSARPLASANATLEKSDSFNDHDSPPTVLSYEVYGRQSGTHLWMETFQKAGANLAPSPGSPFPVADNSLLTANHSGGGNSSFTTKSSIYVVYPTTDKGTGAGTLSVARSFNRATGRWDGPAAPIGRSTTLKGPDNHDLPAITVDPQGRAIAIVGSHHAVLQMYTARKAGTINAGWLPPEPVGDPARGAGFKEYSYASLNMSRSGTINIISRAEGNNGYYELVQFRKAAGSSWSAWPSGMPHRVIATPARHAYDAWRQRVSQSPSGQLVLSFAYFPNQLTDAEAAQFHVARQPNTQCDQVTHRCWYMDEPVLIPRTLTSTDDGKTWAPYSQ